MPTFEVRWAIDVDADSPREAAIMAREHMRRPHTLATFYDVLGDGRVERIDLGTSPCGIDFEDFETVRDHEMTCGECAGATESQEGK